MDEIRKDQYTIEKLSPAVTYLDDYSKSSFYVVEGDTEAFVIDTAMGDGNIPALIAEKVTKKPLTLVVTHGHGDHVMHAGEFDAFYLAKADWSMVENNPSIDLSKAKDLADGQVLTLDGAELIVVDAAGHTPGSVIFIDKKNKYVYTGDAFGSGCGVWMQVPTGLPLSEYAAHLQHVLDALTQYGVDESYEFLGGHRVQQYLSKVAEHNPICRELIADMKTLCEKLIAGEIEGEDAPMTRSFGEPVFYAAYGKAEMIFKKSQVK